MAKTIGAFVQAQVLDFDPISQRYHFKSDKGEEYVLQPENANQEDLILRSLAGNIKGMIRMHTNAGGIYLMPPKGKLVCIGEYMRTADSEKMRDIFYEITPYQDGATKVFDEKTRMHPIDYLMQKVEEAGEEEFFKHYSEK